VFNATFNNIPVISWWSVFLVVETGAPLPHTAEHCQLLNIHELVVLKLIFSGVRVTRSLVLYVCFVDRCLSF
jgi:hypothetical protein